MVMMVMLVQFQYPALLVPPRFSQKSSDRGRCPLASLEHLKPAVQLDSTLRAFHWWRRFSATANPPPGRLIPHHRPPLTGSQLRVVVRSCSRRFWVDCKSQIKIDSKSTQNRLVNDRKKTRNSLPVRGGVGGGGISGGGGLGCSWKPTSVQARYQRTYVCGGQKGTAGRRNLFQRAPQHSHAKGGFPDELT